MQEAKFSLNIRFNFKGYDSQFTMRDDENGAPLLEKFAKVVTMLEKMGALPERRWENVKANGNGNGNGHAAPEPEQKPSKPTCKHCNSSERMELVKFIKDGTERKAWKCQACDKWHYEKKEKRS